MENSIKNMTIKELIKLNQVLNEFLNCRKNASTRRDEFYNYSNFKLTQEHQVAAFIFTEAFESSLNITNTIIHKLLEDRMKRVIKLGDTDNVSNNEQDNSIIIDRYLDKLKKISDIYNAYLQLRVPEMGDK